MAKYRCIYAVVCVTGNSASGKLEIDNYVSRNW